MAAKEEFTGTVNRAYWPTDSDFVLVSLMDKTSAVGTAKRGDLLKGVDYRFYGKWGKHPKYGRQFKFTHFVQTEPHSRHGVVAYLQRYADGVGASIALQLFDTFEGDAIKVLRTEPERAAAACKSLSVDRAAVAAAALQNITALEDTKIELVGLLAGRGFWTGLVDAVINKWDILAPKRIRRDPFTLLVHGFKSCGFARCDRLYLDLGLNPRKFKRQVFCLWHILHSDTDGHTWIPAKDAGVRLGEHVSGAAVDLGKAIRVGQKTGWLETYVNGGQLWLADGKRAENERYLAGKIRELRKGD